MCAFYTREDIPQEQKDKIIEQLAEKILEYKMETAAILTLEMVKPLAYIGGEMSRVFLAPFLSVFGSNINVMGEKYITIFEDRDNIDKLIQFLEEKIEEESEDKLEQKDNKNSKKNLKEKI